MSSIFSSTIIYAAIILAAAAVLFLIGAVLAAKGIITQEELKRAVISAAVFALIYWGSELAGLSKDIYVEAIVFLAAVVGAGCYWIGSNRR